MTSTVRPSPEPQHRPATLAGLKLVWQSRTVSTPIVPNRRPSPPRSPRDSRSAPRRHSRRRAKRPPPAAASLVDAAPGRRRRQHRQPHDGDGSGSSDEPAPGRRTTTLHVRDRRLPQGGGPVSPTAAQLWTADDLAARWQVEPSHVYRLVRQGDVPQVELGKYVRFLPDAIEKFERARRRGMTPVHPGRPARLGAPVGVAGHRGVAPPDRADQRARPRRPRAARRR